MISERKRSKASKDAIRLFTLLALVVVPALWRKMRNLKVKKFPKDPRKIIKKLLNMIRNPTVTLTPINISKPTLEAALGACNNICHRDLVNIYWYRKKYLKDLIQLCLEMGNSTAVSILQQHEILTRPFK